MILDLKPYQASEPYPQVHTIRQDKTLAVTLMKGYCGEVSEMTTVLQYAHHSLHCKSQYAEVSKMMRGIFYVETLHMELLGECVCKLGGSAQYNVSTGEKMICWQGDLVEYTSTPAQMLLADIKGEKEAVAFYQRAASSLHNQPDVKTLLLRLAEDERLHVKMLTDLYDRTFRK